MAILQVEARVSDIEMDSLTGKELIRHTKHRMAEDLAWKIMETVTYEVRELPHFQVTRFRVRVNLIEGE